MKKVFFYLVIIYVLTVAYALACCYLNEEINNGSGLPAWDLKMVFNGTKTAKWHYDGHQNDWHFRQFSQWSANGRTYLRWFDPADGTGTPMPIPTGATIHIGYRFNGPSELLHKWWTDEFGDTLTNGHIQQPSHWVNWRSPARDTVVLTFTDDFIGTGPPDDLPGCPDATIIGNIYYLILPESEVPPDSLINNQNASLMAQFDASPLATGPFNLDDTEGSISFDIIPPRGENLILLYRMENTATSGSMAFGMHDIGDPDRVPSLTNWGLIVLIGLLLLSTAFVLYKKRRTVTG